MPEYHVVSDNYASDVGSLADAFTEIAAAVADGVDRVQVYEHAPLVDGGPICTYLIADWTRPGVMLLRNSAAHPHITEVR